MCMKNIFLSNYNFFIKEDSAFYVYNSLSGAIIELNENLWKYFGTIQQKKRIDKQMFSPVIMNKMLENRIIYIDDEESEYLKFLHNRFKYDDSYLSLIVSPTLECNLNCHYCYEENRNTKMTEREILILKKLINKQSQIKKRIFICWSGGEIMTIWNMVKDLSKYILDTCKKNNCEYDSTVITNGTLLTEKILSEMVDLKVRSIQLTLDGDRDIHNKVKYLGSGKSSYDLILRNIELASKHMKVGIRVNVDKNNASALETVFSDISKLKVERENVSLYFRPILHSLARQPKNELYTELEFSELESKMVKMAKQYDIGYLFSLIPNDSAIRCMNGGLQGFYISPLLKLYKCSMYIDQNAVDKSVGYVSDDGDIVIDNYKLLNSGLNFSPFNNQECKNCKILPLCFGKCQTLWSESGKKDGVGCIPERFSIEEKVRLMIKHNNL